MVDKEVERNTLVVAQGEHPRLYSDGLIASQLHWVDRTPIRAPRRCTVKTRYRQEDIPCLIQPIDDETIRSSSTRNRRRSPRVNPPSSTTGKCVWAAASSNNVSAIRSKGWGAHERSR